MKANGGEKDAQALICMCIARFGSIDIMKNPSDAIQLISEYANGGFYHIMKLMENGENSFNDLEKVKQEIFSRNYDELGTYLGEFHSEDKILVILTNGDFYITGFDTNLHFEDNILRIEKYDANKIWTAVLFDKDQNGFAYIKRFPLDAVSRHQNYLGENAGNELLLLTDTPYPHIRVTMGGADSFREPMEIEADEFIGVKSFKAKGKRITTFEVESVEELEPTKKPIVEEENNPDPENQENSAPDVLDPDEGKSQQDVADEMTGQLHLFN